MIKPRQAFLRLIRNNFRVSQTSLSHLYFESLTLSKAPIGWICCSVAIHLGLFCLLARIPVRPHQEIAFRLGDPGIQVELVPAESSASSTDPRASADAPTKRLSLAVDAVVTQPVTKSENTSRSPTVITDAPSSVRSHQARAKSTDRLADGSPRIGSAVAQPAAKIFTPQPPYPNSARDLGVEGDVRLRVCVGVDGCPRAVEVAHSSGRADFDSSSLTTVRREWRFRPARTTAGTPIESIVLVAIHFTLRS
jgi:TonB family protein